MKFQGKVKLLHDMFWDVKAFATSQSLESSTSLADLLTLKHSFVGNIPLPQNKFISRFEVFHKRTNKIRMFENPFACSNNPALLQIQMKTHEL